MSRVDNILKLVERNVRDAGGREVVPALILAKMDGIQLDICRRGYALQGESTLAMTAGTKNYAVGSTIHKIAGIVPPSTWLLPMEVIKDKKRWAEILNDTSLESCTTPVYCFLWNRTLRFQPAPPTTGETVTLFTYLLSSTALAEGGTPEIPSKWDVALEYGTTWRVLLGMTQPSPQPRPSGTGSIADWMALYEKELNDLKEDAEEEMLAGRKVNHFSDGLGF